MPDWNCVCSYFLYVVALFWHVVFWLANEDRIPQEFLNSFGTFFVSVLWKADQLGPKSMEHLHWQWVCKVTADVFFGGYLVFVATENHRLCWASIEKAMSVVCPTVFWLSYMVLVDCPHGKVSRHVTQWHLNLQYRFLKGQIMMYTDILMKHLDCSWRLVMPHNTFWLLIQPRDVHQTTFGKLTCASNDRQTVLPQHQKINTVHTVA